MALLRTSLRAPRWPLYLKSIPVHVSRRFTFIPSKAVPESASHKPSCDAVVSNRVYCIPAHYFVTLHLLHLLLCPPSSSRSHLHAGECGDGRVPHAARPPHAGTGQTAGTAHIHTTLIVFLPFILHVFFAAGFSFSLTVEFGCTFPKALQHLTVICRSCPPCLPFLHLHLSLSPSLFTDSLDVQSFDLPTDAEFTQLVALSSSASSSCPSSSSSSSSFSSSSSPSSCLSSSSASPSPPSHHTPVRRHVDIWGSPCHTLDVGPEAAAALSLFLSANVRYLTR